MSAATSFSLPLRARAGVGGAQAFILPAGFEVVIHPNLTLPSRGGNGVGALIEDATCL